MTYLIRERDRIKRQDNFERWRNPPSVYDVTGSPGPRGDAEVVFVVLEITDLGGKDVDHVLLVDKSMAQDGEDGRGGVWSVVPFGDEIVDLLRSEGGKDCRKGGDEAWCVEGVFL